ncbi:MAG: hypothetical protein R3B45_01885 [Bdellovibrionota bacterium]
MEIIETFTNLALGKSIYGISYVDTLFPICFLLWSTILFIPLYKIDLVDIVTMMTYLAYCLASSALLIFAIPQRIINTNLQSIFPTFLVVIFLTTAKWGLSHRKQKNLKLIEIEKMKESDNG